MFVALSFDGCFFYTEVEFKIVYFAIFRGSKEVNYFRITRVSDYSKFRCYISSTRFMFLNTFHINYFPIFDYSKLPKSKNKLNNPYF